MAIELSIENSLKTKKYLSIYYEKFIPDFIKEQYPLYKKFIKYFFEYLEKKGNLYEQIQNIGEYINLSDIFDLEDETLREKLIFQLYEQFLGSAEARAVTSLLSNDELYIKNQKLINAYKGTEFCFLFLFLLILKGFFNIINVNSNTRKHNGRFLYNGNITYSNTSSEDKVEPFVYLIESEFYPEQYDKVLQSVNPAGMLPLKFFTKNIYILSLSTSIIDLFNNNLYVGIKNNLAQSGENELLGYLKPYRKEYFKYSNQRDKDKQLINSTYIEYTNNTDFDGIILDVTFNTKNFNETQFNEISLINYIGSDTSLQLDNDIPPSEYVSILIDNNKFSTTETFPIINNTNITIIIEV